MREVYTREGFEVNRKDDPQPIMCKGILAQEMRSRKKLARWMIIIGMVLVVAGVAAIILLYHSQNADGPEVGLIGTEGAESGGVHIGGFSISTAALAIVVGGIIALIGIFKGRKIQLNSDGTVIVN